MKREQEEERLRKETAAAQIRGQENDEKEREKEEAGKTEPTPAQKKSFRNWLARFFGKAPSGGGAVLDW